MANSTTVRSDLGHLEDDHDHDWAIFTPMAIFSRAPSSSLSSLWNRRKNKVRQKKTSRTWNKNREEDEEAPSTRINNDGNPNEIMDLDVSKDKYEAVDGDRNAYVNEVAENGPFISDDKGITGISDREMMTAMLTAITLCRAAHSTANTSTAGSANGSSTAASTSTSTSASTNASTRTNTRASSVGISGTYSPDCYSFLALHGPIENMYFFCFGVMVFVFQFTFLILMILSVVDTRLRTNGEVDNPDSNWLAGFIPANASRLVRGTQITAILSYMVFADDSLLDTVKAIEMFPRFDQTNADKTGCMMFSSVLRFTQGILAIIAVLLLVMTSSDVIDIILNFTAVNFISAMDDVAFRLATWGKYGPTLAIEAKRIETLPLPKCIFRKRKHKRYRIVVVPIAIILLIVICIIVGCQESKQLWLTRTLRVQFQEDTGLEAYSGCYEIDEDVRAAKRYNYNSNGNNTNRAKLGYCKAKRRWLFFEGNTSESDACEAGGDELAHSSKTDFFDISMSFGEDWLSAGNTPLDMYFIDDENGGETLEAQCGTFVDDGKCDPSFNNFNYQYDGGDCCAATCTEPEECGNGSAKDIFGTANTGGISYPNCIDPDMTPVTITLGSFSSSQILTLFELECDGKLVLSAFIIETLVNESETSQIDDDEARCIISVRSFASRFNYTVEHDYDPKLTNVQKQLFKSIPSEIGLLKNLTVLDLTGKDLTGSIPSEIGLMTSLTDLQLGTQNPRQKPANKPTKDTIQIPTTRQPTASPTASSTSTGRERQLSEIRLLTDSTLLDLEHNAAVSPTGAVDPCPALTGKCNSCVNNKACLWCRDNNVCFNSNPDVANSGSSNNGNDTVPKLRFLQPVGEQRPPPVCKGTATSSESVCDMINSPTRSPMQSPSPNVITSNIPTEIGLLTNLKGLGIDNNELTGTIPSELGLLTNMLALDLEENQLTGTIPTEIGMLRNIYTLSFAFNNITGIIPIEILYSNMGYLLLAGNDMTGPIPSEIGMLTNLAELDLDGNNFTGSIPTEIGLLTSVSIIKLRDNYFTSTIPTEIGLLTNLKELWLDENTLSDSVPSEIGLLTDLTNLKLNNNTLNGVIPSEIGLLTSLTVLDLDGNAFGGSIPSEIGLLTDLTYLQLDGNELSGTIPSEIGFLTALTALGLNGNALSGVVPSEIGLLTDLTLPGYDGNPYLILPTRSPTQSPTQRPSRNPAYPLYPPPKSGSTKGPPVGLLI